MATKAQSIDLDALAAAVAQSVAVSTATAQAVEALAESVSSLKAGSAKAGKAGSAKAGSAGKAESAASNDYSRGLITLPSAAFGAKVSKGDSLRVTCQVVKAGKAAGKAVVTVWTVSKVTETERGERVRADAEREGSALA